MSGSKIRNFQREDEEAGEAKKGAKKEEAKRVRRKPLDPGWATVIINIVRRGL